MAHALRDPVLQWWDASDTGRRPDSAERRVAGRFRIDDPKVALACAGGATLGVLSLTMNNPKPKAIDAAADELVTNLLRMFGLPDPEAREIAHRPLPKP